MKARAHLRRLRRALSAALLLAMLSESGAARAQSRAREPETAGEALGRVGLEILFGGAFATAAFFGGLGLGALACDGGACNSPGDDGDGGVVVALGVGLLLGNAAYPAGVYTGGRLAGARGTLFPTYASTLVIVGAGGVGMLIDPTVGLAILAVGSVVDLLGAIIGFEASHAADLSREPGIVAAVSPTPDGRGALLQIAVRP